MNECDDDDDDSDDSDDDSDDSDDSDREFRLEFKKYKAHYYIDKLDFERVTQSVCAYILVFVHLFRLKCLLY